MRIAPAALVFLLTPLAFSQTVEVSRAALIGFLDQAIEDEGKITRLDITAKVRVTTPGTYRLTLDLTARDGRGLTGHARGQLERGDRSLIASFTAEEISDYLAQDGPYTISDARLFLEVNGYAGDAILAASSASDTSTRAYRLLDFYQNPYALTGEIEAEGIDVQPSGKFGALRVRLGVTTPGATCALAGTLSDQKGTEIDFENSPSYRLSAGKSTVELIFPSPKIIAHGVDGPFVIYPLNIGCRRDPDLRPAHLELRTRFRTPSFRLSDFDTPSADFQLSLDRATYRVPAGIDVLSTVIIHVGFSGKPVALTVHASEPRLRSLKPPGEFSCDTCGQMPVPLNFSIQVPADLPSGNYPVEVTGRRDGHEHTVQFIITVDAELTRQVQVYKKTVVDLARPDPPAAPPPAPVASAETNPLEVNRDARFSAEVTLRRIHAVLVMSNSRGGFGCDLLKASAIRFSRLFVDGRDSLAVISFGIGARMVVPLSDHFPGDLDDRMKKTPCDGQAHNTGAALQLARQQLMQHRDPEAIDVVVLITSGPADALTAAWPANKQPDGSSCTESREGRVTAIALPRYVVTEIYPRQEAGPLLLPPDFSDPATQQTPEERMIQVRYIQDFDKKDSCFGQGFLRSKETLTSIPARDANAIALTGSYPLERWPAGPHANEIRIDSRENILSASANQIENIAKEMRSGPESAFVYVIAPDLSPYVSLPGNQRLTLWPESLQRLTNDPGNSSFNRDQPAGLAILIDNAQAVWPAFERIRHDIVERATIK